MEYSCNKCNKKYASYKSLWFHNYKYHKIENNTENTHLHAKIPLYTTEIPPKKMMENKCNNCNIIFSRKDSLTRHNKTNKCKNITLENNNKIEVLEKEMAEYKAEMERLKLLLQKSMKIHPKQLQKINNTLNNNTTNNTTQNIINNNYYLQLGKEDLVNVLTKSQKRAILNRKAMGINDLVELIHCSGKYKQFMNVYITNLQNTVAYRYDDKTNSFIATDKNEVLNDLIDCRMYDIQKFFDEAENILDSNTASDIKRIIKKMNEDDCFKGLKKDEIKFILYNNKDKIISEKDKFINELEV